MFQKKVLLNGLIDSFLLDRMNFDYYKVSQVDPINLYTWNRLDLAFKKLFLELRGLNSSVAENYYRHDIRSQTLGQYHEIGNDDKSSFEKYKQVFENLVESMQHNDFCEKTSLIPLASDGSILNGAHRTASALHQMKNLMAVETCLKPLIVDYDYFLKRAVPVSIVESAVSKLLECGDDFYICFLWSSGKENWRESHKLFSQIAFQKDLHLSMNGAINLLYECYSHMHWVGNEATKYYGLRQKLTECFPNEFMCRVIVFQEKKGLKEVRRIKEKVRFINKIGFSSVHITDTKDEVLRLSPFILNSNAFHFLNCSRPSSFRRSAKKIPLLQTVLAECDVQFEDVVVDGSFVMEMYGLKQANDIDYLLADCVSQSAKSRLGNREEQLEFHGVSKNDLIYNFKYYFYFHGLKIISLKQLFVMKKRRSEAKDLLDCRSISSLYSPNGKVKAALFSGLQSVFYLKVKIKRLFARSVVSLLKIFRCYEMLKSIKSHFSNVKGA